MDMIAPGDSQSSRLPLLVKGRSGAGSLAVTAPDPESGRERDECGQHPRPYSATAMERVICLVTPLAATARSLRPTGRAPERCELSACS